MRSLYRLSVIGIFCLLALPILGQEQKKAEPKDPKKEEFDPFANKKPPVVWGQTFDGKISKVKNGEIVVKRKVAVRTPAATKRLLDWQRDLQRRQFDIARQRNPRQRARLIAQYQAKLRQRPPGYEIKEQDTTVYVAEDMRIRRWVPEVQYDDKGNVVKMTPEVLKKLKGDEPKLPGYPVEITSLRQNQPVKVYLARPTAPDATKKDKKKEKGIGIDIFGKEDKKAVGEAKGPKAVMILITGSE